MNAREPSSFRGIISRAATSMSARVAWPVRFGRAYAGKEPILDGYLLLLVIFGAVILLTAWLPLVLDKLPLSLPIGCIVLGLAIGWSPLVTLFSANPLENREVTERLTEVVVIVALMGAGLKIARPIGVRDWILPWRLLALAMPLTIVGIALAACGLLGLPVASAVLLGAVLAPTDPVLASDVQLDPPLAEGSDEVEEEDDVRFGLTAEAGLNDGLSFPFVYLAIALALAGSRGEPWLRDWLWFDVVCRITVGIGSGWIIGRLLGLVIFRLPNRTRLSSTGDGFVALGATLLAYGLTELLHGYGFLAVFVAALTLRSTERRHRYHADLHAFSEQIERLLMMALLVCFGVAIAEGTVFGGVTWRTVAVALLVLFVIRPLCGWLCLVGVPLPWRERAAIAFFGIRGLGSFYYLAFALGEAEFTGPEVLWATVCLVVLGSILLHGITVTPAMLWLDRSATE